MPKTLAIKFQIRVPSFTQQADLLQKALAPFYDRVIIAKSSLYGQAFDVWLVFTPALASYLYQLAFGGSMIHAKRIMYITAEGIPTISSAQRNLLTDRSMKWSILAVSEFSKRMLEKAGLEVNGVIPHAIDETECYQVSEQASALRKHYENLFPNRVLFAYTGSTVARKQVQRMIPAFRKAVEKTGNKIALISNSHLSPRSAPNVISPNPQPIKPDDAWCLEENIFGKAPHSYVMALHSACDYFLWATACEGFGVPPLEAMSCSKPVIAGKFAPNTEFMHDGTTIWYDTPIVKYENFGLEQEFEMHYYDEGALVDAIVQATDIFINYKNRYTEMCEQAQKQASQYDYRKVYGKQLMEFL